MKESFNKARFMSFPRQINLGHNVIETVALYCKEMGLSGTALVVSGPTTRKIAGNMVYDQLTDKQFNAHIVETKVCDQATVDKVESLAKEVGANFLVGVGGGSKIEITKIAATNLKMPYVSIPTQAPHDGIGSPRAILYREGKEHTRASISVHMPYAIIADTAVIKTAPYRTLAAGTADIISNATAVLDWELARRLTNAEYSNSAATLSKMTSEVGINYASFIKRYTEESVYVAVRPILVSGICMSIAGSSAPASGSEHKFAHAIEAMNKSKALHGEIAGVGAIMMMYLHGGDWKRVRTALETLEAPTSAKDLGVAPEDVVLAMTQAAKMKPFRYTILGTTGLTEEAAFQVASKTGVV